MKEEQRLYSRGESEDYRPEKVKIELKKNYMELNVQMPFFFTLISSSEVPSYIPDLWPFCPVSFVFSALIIIIMSLTSL